MTVEWSFPECFSQSTIVGRNGSNACAFIYLYFRQVRHDERFDQEAVNLDAEEAVEMAGEDCGVVSLGQQLDLFGTSGKELLARWLNELSSRKKRSCHLFCVSEKTMLLFVDSYGKLYFVDSHLHKDSGALIACAPPSNGSSFANWIYKMMEFHWQTPLTLGTVREAIYG